MSTRAPALDQTVRPGNHDERMTPSSEKAKQTETVTSSSPSAALLKEKAQPQAKKETVTYGWASPEALSYLKLQEQEKEERAKDQAKPGGESPSAEPAASELTAVQPAQPAAQPAQPQPLYTDPPRKNRKKYPWVPPMPSQPIGKESSQDEAPNRIPYPRGVGQSQEPSYKETGQDRSPLLNNPVDEDKNEAEIAPTSPIPWQEKEVARADARDEEEARATAEARRAEEIGSENTSTSELPSDSDMDSMDGNDMGQARDPLTGLLLELNSPSKERMILQ